MLKIKLNSTSRYELKPFLVCAVSGGEIEDATHANVIWVYQRPLSKDSQGRIIGDPIIVSKECSARSIIDNLLGIEDDPDCTSQWMQLDEYLTTLCKDLGAELPVPPLSVFPVEV